MIFWVGGGDGGGQLVCCFFGVRLYSISLFYSSNILLYIFIHYIFNFQLFEYVLKEIDIFLDSFIIDCKFYILTYFHSLYHKTNCKHGKYLRIVSDNQRPMIES